MVLGRSGVLRPKRPDGRKTMVSRPPICRVPSGRAVVRPDHAAGPFESACRHGEQILVMDGDVEPSGNRLRTSSPPVGDHAVAEGGLLLEGSAKPALEPGRGQDGLFSAEV